MSEDVNDPSANTMAWKAWVDKEAAATSQPEPKSRLALLAGGGAAVIVVLVVVLYLLLA